MVKSIKNFVVIIGLTAFALACSNDEMVYKDPKASIDDRVEDLLSRMTLEEKVAQTMGHLGFMKPSEPKTFFGDTIGNSGWYLDSVLIVQNFKHGAGVFRDAFSASPEFGVKVHNALQRYLVEETRLGIPAFVQGEACHGYTNDECTTFPMPLAMSSSFNEELINEVYTIAAREATSRGVKQLLSPTLDVVRDNRWGRISETFGEDSYLNTQMTLAIVKALQGTGDDLLGEAHAFATLKHYPSHGAPLGGHNCGKAMIGERELWNVHLQPFKKIIDEGHGFSVMPMYGEIDGDVVHASKKYMKDILRDELGFKGFTVSDYDGIKIMMYGKQGIPDDNLQFWEFWSHHIAEDSLQAAKKAALAGVDIELAKPTIYPHLTKLVNEGALEESVIDDMLRNILKHKFMIGLFENPYADPQHARAVVEDPQSNEIALKAAKQSIVMLENKDNILPLDAQKIKKIAVIGPNADRMLLGDYSTKKPRYFVTVKEGIQKRVGDDVEVVYAQGANIDIYRENDKSFIKPMPHLIEEAVKVAKDADVIVLAVGGSTDHAQEGLDRHNLGLVGEQEELIHRLKALDKPVILCMIGTLTYAIPDIYEKVDGVYQCFFLGQETGTAIASALFGDHNPSGKLAITIPKSVGHLPAYYSKKPADYMREYNFDDGDQGGFCYTFGYGLSYTDFEFSNLRLEKNQISASETIKVFVDVENTGSVKGTEVVQMYIRDHISDYTRPMKELKGFTRITLEPGQEKTVELEITPESLSYYGEDMKFVLEPGLFRILVGNSSLDRDLLNKELMVAK